MSTIADISAVRKHMFMFAGHDHFRANTSQSLLMARPMSSHRGRRSHGHAICVYILGTYLFWRLQSSLDCALSTAPGQIDTGHEVSCDCGVGTAPASTPSPTNRAGFIRTFFGLSMGQLVCMSAHCLAGRELVDRSPSLRRHGIRARIAMIYSTSSQNAYLSMRSNQMRRIQAASRTAVHLWHFQLPSTEDEIHCLRRQLSFSGIKLYRVKLYVSFPS